MSRIFISFALVVALGIRGSSTQRYTVHGCKDGQVRLNCRTGNIQVVDVLLGDSSCYGARCCPRANDCMGAPSSSYRDSVHRSCNGVTFCSVGVEIKSIGCSILAPRNDYTNITYECLAPTTTTVATQPTSTSLPTTSRTSTRVPSLSSSKADRPSVTLCHTTTPEEDLNHSTEKSSTKAAIETKPATETKSTVGTSPEDSKHTTEKSTKRAIHVEAAPESRSNTTSHDNKTPGQQTPTITPEIQSLTSVKSSTVGNPELLVALHQKDVNENGHLDGVTKLVAVIVVGIVITVTVISVAVVVALKKRRVVEKNDDYTMPTMTSCSAEAAGDTERNANFYDFIPDVRDSGNWTPSRAEDASGDDPYLKPIMDEADQEHYIWIS